MEIALDEGAKFGDRRRAIRALVSQHQDWVEREPDDPIVEVLEAAIAQLDEDDLLSLGATNLYRFFDAQGGLLYIGISYNAWARMAGHRMNASWWSQVASASIEHFPTRAEAAQAERSAIEAERPAHNVAYNQSVDTRSLEELRDLADAYAEIGREDRVS